MRKDVWFDSKGKGKIHVCRWEPETEPKAVVQIVHGIAEYAMRYEPFAEFLNAQGYLVVAEDHMGHGESIAGGSIQGYFHGGWFTAVDDTYQLLQQTREEFQDIPYVLFGHSMGSFMTRTILQEYPDSGIACAIICGTGWLPEIVIKTGLQAAKTVCHLSDETQPNVMLQKLVFSGYNQRVEHKRTAFDWLNRDTKAVDAYIADPKCGFIASAGLLRAMLTGILHIQKLENLLKMDKNLPIYFIAGGDDPVGSYGKGVLKAAAKFEACGMQNITSKIYPLCRHEILNELNRQEVFDDVAKWINTVC